jgi:plasmid stability protein
VKNRNLTLSLPEDLIREAKVYAAEHDTSLNALMRGLLEEAVSRKARIKEAADRLLAMAERGPYSTIDPGSIRREDLHERW